MSNITDLVPPLDICKLIPEGEFSESALVWFSNYHFGGFHVEKRGLAADLTDNGEIYPAPTLQELLNALPDWSELAVDFVNPQITLKLKRSVVKVAPAEVLKIFLKLKGIEYEE